MIKVVIVDDEQHCIDRLSKLLNPSHSNLLEIVGTALTIEHGIEKIISLKPDLIFLDVQIDNKTGFDLLRALPEINFAIIFTTAYEKFAIQAIKFSAIDYLLKPIDKDELQAALMKLINEKAKQLTAEKIATLLQNTQKNNGIPQKLIIPTISGFEFLDIANIARCQSDVNYLSLIHIS